MTLLPLYAWQAYVSKRVKVTVSYKPLVEQIGVLSHLEFDGEATVIDDDGIKHYCWPALDIEVEI